VKVGDRLIDIADLSVVWVSAEFYESELSMLQTGQQVTVTTSSYPNDHFEGQIAVINPFLEQAKRIARVRIDIPNPDFKLRPGCMPTSSWGWTWAKVSWSRRAR